MSKVVPEGWKRSSIGQIASTDSLFSDGDWVESKDQDMTGSNRLIQLADIGDGEFLNKSSRYMNDEQFDRLRCTALKKDDILIARMPEPLGRACLYPFKYGKAATVVDVAILRTNNANHYWLMSAINSSDYRHQIELNASGTTRTRIARGVLANIEILEPPLQEQQKIATILSSVDNVIEKTRAQIDKLKDLKTGMMQELLTKGIGHTEFKDSPVGKIPATWNVLALRELIRVIESGWSPQCESISAQGNEWAVLKTTAVSWEGFDFKANKKLPCELEPRPEIQVETHDILVTRAGPTERVGVVSYVKSVPAKIMLSDKIIRIKSDLNQNPYFLSLWLSTEYAKSYLLKRTTGLAQSQTNISQSILQSLLCVVPPLKEQKAISSIFLSIEENLADKRNKLIQCQNIKQSIMQELLAGKVRVR